MKTYLLFIIILLTLFVFLAINFSCGDDDDDASGDDDSDDDDDATVGGVNQNEIEEQVWSDPATGLMWQLKGLVKNSWEGGIYHCENLKYGGYDDWRLPTISELRSLIQGCEKNETNGDCGVTDECVEAECIESCDSCKPDEGPSDGCYWPEEIERNNYYTCDRYWSSSSFIDLEYDEEYAWTLDFYSGSLHWFSTYWDDSEDDWPLRIRCVRQDKIMSRSHLTTGKD